MQEDIIFGRNTVREALASGREINKVMVLEGKREAALQRLVEQAKENRCVIQYVDRSALDRITDNSVHQGIVAYIAPYAYSSIDAMVALAEQRGEAPLVIVCDGISDPHNLGSILRTVDAVGAHGVIIPKRKGVLLNQTVAKAASGAAEYVPVARVTNVARVLAELKEKGFWVVGTEMGAPEYTAQDLSGALAVVIGSEGQGITRNVKAHCDFLVSIPMLGHVTSLNASVAAAVVLYEIRRQRK